MSSSSFPVGFPLDVVELLLWLSLPLDVVVEALLLLSAVASVAGVVAETRVPDAGDELETDAAGAGGAAACVVLAVTGVSVFVAVEATDRSTSLVGTAGDALPGVMGVGDAEEAGDDKLPLLKLTSLTLTTPLLFSCAVVVSAM